MLVASAAPALWIVAVWVAALAVALVAVSFLRADAPGAGRRVEAAAGVWTLALYLTLGPLSLWLR